MGVKNVGKGWCFLHRRTPLAAMLALLVLCPPAMAASSICLDNYTMSMPFNYTVGYAGNLHNITISKDVPCAYGCAENTCNPDPFWGLVGAIVGIIGFVVVVSWVIKKV